MEIELENYQVRFRNILTAGDPVELLLKVDTGATMLVLPGWVQRELQFLVMRKQKVRHAGAETAEWDVVYGVEV